MSERRTVRSAAVLLGIPLFALLFALTAPLPLVAENATATIGGESGEREEEERDRRRSKFRWVEIEALEFGRVVVERRGRGYIRLDAASGQKITGGSVFDLGGRAGAAEFVIKGQPGERFRIYLPSRVELAEGVLTDFTLDRPAEGRFGSSGRERFAVGATLSLAGTRRAGKHRAPILLLVESYP